MKKRNVSGRIVLCGNWNECLKWNSVKWFLFLFVSFTGIGASGAVDLVYYDIASAPNTTLTLPPVYVNGSDSYVTVSNLTAVGVYWPAHTSDIESLGDFIFTQWPVKDYAMPWTSYYEFTITANRPIVLDSMQYTFFGGLWSNMGGCRGVAVRVSRDGFQSYVSLLETTNWNVTQTLPWVYDCPNDFDNDLSILGLINQGETLTFRIYGLYADYGHIPSGLWNKSENDYNLTIQVAEIFPTLEIDEAFCLRFMSQSAKTYRLEYSEDLNNWAILEDDIQGTGEYITRFFLFNEYQNNVEFFRIIPLNVNN